MKLRLILVGIIALTLNLSHATRRRSLPGYTIASVASVPSRYEVINFLPECWQTGKKTPGLDLGPACVDAVNGTRHCSMAFLSANRVPTTGAQACEWSGPIGYAFYRRPEGGFEFQVHQWMHIGERRVHGGLVTEVLGHVDLPAGDFHVDEADDVELYNGPANFSVTDISLGCNLGKRCLDWDDSKWRCTGEDGLCVTYSSE